MNKVNLFVAVALYAIFLLPSPVVAQVPIQRGIPSPVGPTVSPYLNLLRPGNPTALNYYGLVRPQFQTIAGFQGVQQRFDLLSAGSQANPVQLNDGLITGNAATFMNFNSYFMTTNVGPGRSGSLNPIRAQSLPNQRPARR